MFFLPHVISLYQPTTYTENDDIEKERWGSPQLFFLFSANILGKFKQIYNNKKV